jgi:hypothetical protein
MAKAFGEIEAFVGADLYWIDTGWACGAVFVIEGRIVGGAPVFRRLRGQTLSRLPAAYAFSRIG